ncbi:MULTISPECIES: hypothetical protein [unclassified Rhodosalinus]|uniref:hypothetical protein n=1 Tax=unclassified Rhodosalinus TaxID=2630183 RepID=UPI0035249303
MDRLSIFLTLASGPVAAGSLVIAVLSLGYYNWLAIGIAAAIGFALAWPTAYLISRRIKRRDPDWKPDAEPGDYGPLPPRDAPEV